MKRLIISHRGKPTPLLSGNSRLFDRIEIEFLATGQANFRLEATPENLWINEAGNKRKLVGAHYWRWTPLNIFPTSFTWSNPPSEVHKKGGKKIIESGELHELTIELEDDCPF